MANILNSKPTDTDQEAGTQIDKNIPNKIKEKELKTDVTETDVERSFKEGLANNSDTDKSSPQQK